MENVAGLVGLTLIGFAVALFLLGPDWVELGRQALQQTGLGSEKVSTYWYYAIALFGAAMTPYEVFFFSSGAVEEGWTAKDLAQSRANVLVGFPLGGVLSLAIAGCAAVVLLPQLIAVTSLSQVMLPVAVAGGKLLLAVIIIGVVAATFGAALETTLSAGYTIAQFFGWPWGKFRAPAHAARFHLLMIICLIVGVGVLLTGIDPVQVTELSVVFSAVALPLTYLPILIVANDPEYMGRYVNSRPMNAAALVYLVIILIASLSAIPAHDHHRSRPMKPPDHEALAGRLLDAQLHLLDRQVIDVHGAPVTAVDDVELSEVVLDEDLPPDTPAPVIVALLSGPVLGTRLFGGRPPESRLIRTPWSAVYEIGVAIKLAVAGEVLDVTWTERWVRDKIIGRIPGGRHDPDAGGPS